MALRFNYNSYDDLPTRAKNIVEGLGGLEKALAFYKKNGSFIKIQNTGNKTNLELISLCENILIHEDSRNLEEFHEFSNAIPSLPKNMQELIDLYLIRKISVTTRLRNYLNQLEEEANFGNGLDWQGSFIFKYFICEFHFMGAKNLGIKTVNEIELIRDQIRSRINNVSDDFLADNEELSKAIYRKFSFTIPLEEITKIISNNGDCYNFPLLLKLYLNHQKLHYKTKEAIDLFYFKRKVKDYNSITRILKCTKERARQLKVSIKEKIIPNAIRSILFTLDGITYYLENQYESVIELFIENENENNLSYNSDFLKCIYSHLNNSEYYIFEDLLLDSKSFVVPINTILIAKKFAETIQLIHLLSFLDNEIYNFEIIEFDYNLKVLIQRFYDEHELEISMLNLNLITDLVEKSIRKDWPDIEAAVKRSKKKKEKEEIYGLVEEFISEKNEPQKTKAILEFLSNNFIEISKEFLLHILNKNISRFQRVGNGYWTITELDKNVHGSLREIIEQKLYESKIPLHISEIHEYVNSLRPISEHSLRSNMRMEEDKIFTFFNCSFIGLSAKIYDEYWHQIPKVKASHIKSMYYANQKFSSEQEKIRYYANLFNYPEIHVKYLLRMRETQLSRFF